MVNITIPAGRYYIGDVVGLTKPLVAIPARSSIFYDDEMSVEVEIAGGGSCMPNEDAFGIFGIIEFENTGLPPEQFGEMSSSFEVAEPTEVLFNYDYLEVVGVMKFSLMKDLGLKFTSTDEEVELAMGE